MQIRKQIKTTMSLAAAMGAFAMTSTTTNAATMTFGNTPVDGGADTVGSAGFVMISTSAGGGDAGVVTEFSFYSKISGTTITPLIFDNAFNVIGEGTTRTTTTDAGIETFAFGLVAGSADIGPDKFFGWQPAGTDVSPVAFNNLGHSTSYFLSPVAVESGETASITGTLPRTYSMQFTVDTVPEPSTTALLGLGGLALILRRRK
jgi:hypothetical protein